MTRETIKGGSRTFDFDYSESAFADDYNHWKRKTTETLPSGDQNIVYSNYAGQTMLAVFQSDSDQWCRFFKYDDDGKSSCRRTPRRSPVMTNNMPTCCTWWTAIMNSCAIATALSRPSATMPSAAF